jgi:hypothetical protein
MVAGSSGEAWSDVGPWSSLLGIFFGCSHRVLEFLVGKNTTRKWRDTMIAERLLT